VGVLLNGLSAPFQPGKSGCTESDKAPQFVANMVQFWCREFSVDVHNIEPGGFYENLTSPVDENLDTAE
jgi:hypothetical protein